MADARFRDMNWGKEKPHCCGKEEAFYSERSQEEREGKREQQCKTCDMEILWVALGKKTPLPGGMFTSPRTKGLPGTIEWPFNIRRQRCMQRADNLVAAFYSALL